MSFHEVVYAPPKGKPLGINLMFRVGSWIVIPILELLTKRDWRGIENLPKSGPVIAISNHISYADPLIFAHFLFSNGRAVRFLAKASLFKVPVLGFILRTAGQVPVDREIKGSEAMPHALAFLKAGHCVGIYPEGTLTRDKDLWPMKAKTGLARLAIISKAPVIPCAQWGAEDILMPYAKVPRIFKRTKVTVVAGPALDFSPWYGKEDDFAAVQEATEYAMSAVTRLLEEIRGELAPADIFDPRSSDLPTIGNFKKKKRK
jgi:1-acyl-sn-glycerol-3-phosphate acyltransferase